MSRRNSVSVKDIVFSDLRANKYYNSQKSLDEDPPAKSEAKGVAGLTDMRRITLPDLPVDIECDPVALADFLLLKEEEECCDIDDFSPNLPSATLLQRSDAKATSTSPSAPVPKLAKQATSKISAERKQSALVEHERIRQALNDCGFLLEF